MRLTSKATLIAISLIALLTVASAYAQSNDKLRVNVPFQFLAGNTVMPAGEYRIVIDPASQRMTFRTSDGGAGFSLYASLREKKGDMPETGLLVFHRYGNTHFLRAAYKAGDRRGFEIPASRAEREMAKNIHPSEVAAVGVN